MRHIDRPSVRLYAGHSMIRGAEDFVSALVLVADSDPFSLRLLSEVCESSGHTAVGAATGEEVLDRVARDRPDLLLLDAALPRMDGLEVLRILKGDRQLARIPVLLAGDLSQTARVEEGVRLGATRWIAKPYRVAEVQRGIAEGLAGIPSIDSAPPRMTPGTEAQLHLSLEYEMLRAARYDSPLGCIVFQLQGVAQLSDERAEAALAHVHDALRACTRAVDQLFRAEHEHIALILPETDAMGTGRVLERTRAAARKALHDLGDAAEVEAACATYPTDKVREGTELLGLARSRL